MEQKKKSNIIWSCISAPISLMAVALMYYIKLPPINALAIEFWIFLSISIAVIGLPLVMINVPSEVSTPKAETNKKSKTAKKKGRVKKSRRLNFKDVRTKIFIASVLIPLIVLLVGLIGSSAFFNATTYSEIIKVEERVFEDDMPVTTSVTNIALMDSASATVFGNRALGSLANVVSQYDLWDKYTQINYQGKPQKVANLEYGDFFKWLNNMDSGIPGYVMVDPVGNDADYHELKTPMKYAESAFFNEDLMRKLRFSYPSKIFDTVSFEIDEDGNPFYIVACKHPRIGLFGAYDINEVIVFNPCDGSSQIYSVEDTPSWIDVVYNGNLACQKYNWKGLYSNGFFNSIIGNVDCKQTTDDYGYIVIGDDVWYFTGVTSVSSDKSNIGFIITNARTGEYKFYPVVGAEEHSAMSAAQGRVQEKGYVASFPSLVNISGEATYIMVLKDDYGMVQLYALVNVENYALISTASTQKDAIDAYNKLLLDNGITEAPEPPAVETKSATVTVSLVRIINDAQGDPIVYLNTSAGVFKKSLTADESLILIEAGDTLTIEYSETEVDNIFLISKWNKQ